MKSATSTLLLSLCLLASAATAARTDEGTWSMTGSLMVDFASYVGTETDLDLTIGQYVRTGLLAGGYVGVLDNDLITVLDGGATFKLHVLDSLTSPFSPFIGADLGLVNCSTASDDVFALVVGVRVGFDFFFTEAVALDAALDARIATDDVYTGDDDPLTNNDIRFKVGLALFF